MELTQFITASLAPAVAMSTSALLATGMQARYGDIVRRIRSLADERRDLGGKASLTSAEGERFFSLEGQIALLLHRARLMQYTVMLLYAAIFGFLATSFAIAFISEQHVWALEHVPKGLFLVGLGCLAAGVCLEVLEMRLAFRIVKYEVGTIGPG